MDWSIPPEWVTGTGFLTAITVVYYMLLTGRLATGRELSEKNAEIAENRATIRELLEQNGVLVRENETTVKAMEALRSVAERGQS